MFINYVEALQNNTIVPIINDANFEFSGLIFEDAKISDLVKNMGISNLKNLIIAWTMINAPFIKAEIMGMQS